MKISFLAGPRGRLLLSIGTTVFVGLGIVTSIVTDLTVRTVRAGGIMGAQKEAAVVAGNARLEAHTAPIAASWEPMKKETLVVAGSLT